MKIKLLELFAGSGILSKTFKEAGHEVMTLDFNPKYNPDICCDILDFKIPMLNGFEPNVLLAGIDCTCFSVASMGYHWTGGYRAYIPKTEAAKKALIVVDKTFAILKQLNPDVFYFENTEGIFKKLPIVMEYRRKYFYHDLTLCQYGTPGRKPSFWLTNNPFWKPKPKCHNGDPCHEAAPRGSHTGTQGLKNAYERSKYPNTLCLEILRATEDASTRAHDRSDRYPALRRG